MHLRQQLSDLDTRTVAMATGSRGRDSKDRPHSGIVREGLSSELAHSPGGHMPTGLLHQAQGSKILL